LDSALKEAAQKKLAAAEPAAEPRADTDHAASQGDHVATTRAWGIEANIQALQDIRNWVMENLTLLLQDPRHAEQELRKQVDSLSSKNEAVKVILSDVGLGESDTINFADLGANLRKAEQVQLDILQEIGPLKKRRGRPFGSIKVERPETEPDQCKRKRNTKRKNLEGSGGTEETAKKERKAGPDEPDGSGDPFADLEQKEPNKALLIPLYKKCLIIDFALNLQKEQPGSNIEKEVMVRFKKFFWSYEHEKWKSGLLGKWIKYPGCCQ